MIVGRVTADRDEPWYFSLNNRRLWVLKRCREEGLLENNRIAVRVRAPASASEAARYTVDKCALDAKFIRESSSGKKNTRVEEGETGSKAEAETETSSNRLDLPLCDSSARKQSDDPDDSSSSSGSSDGVLKGSNPFAALS